MSHANLSRRAILAGAASASALTLPAVAAASTDGRPFLSNCELRHILRRLTTHKRDGASPVLSAKDYRR